MDRGSSLRRLLTLVLLSACAVPRGGLDIDSGAMDVPRVDAPIDAGVDGGADAGVDAPADTGPGDTGMDVLDVGVDAGPACSDVAPLVQWNFSGTTPLADLAAPAPRMDLRWEPLEGEFVGGAATFDGDRLVAESAASTMLGAMLVASDELTVEGWIARDSAATGAASTAPRRIFGCSETARRRAFTIGQTDAELVVRLRSSNSATDNGDEFGAAFFPAASPRHFAVTWDGRRARIYVDGVEAAVDDHGGGADLVFDAANVCLLGDELDGARAWAGSVYSLRIFDAVIDEADIACFATSAP